MADAWALKQLGNYADGKLIMTAWLNRGLTKLEDLAAWHWDGDIKVAGDHMKHCRHKVIELMSIKGLPEESDFIDANSKAAIEAAESSILEGEKTAHWCLAPVGAPAIALPNWMRIPIDRTVSIWLSEKAKWDEKIAKRHKTHATLPKAQNEKYQAWLSDGCIRRIVMNKERQTQILQLDPKRLSGMTKNLLVMKLRLNNDSEKIQIECVSGKSYPLALLQGVADTTTIPADFEQLPGLYTVYIYIMSSIYI